MSIEELLEPKEMETLIMALRYRYYVLSDPAIPDAVYDSLERKARSILPDDSPVQGLGSDLESSYTEEQKELARLWNL